MNLIEIFSILIIHWIADFVLQTDEQAKGKSTNLDALLTHTFIYSNIWYFVYALGMMFTEWEMFPMWSGIKFFAITFVFHTITDYFTSRLNSKLWKEGRTHDFFVSVGFDQVLHYVQLFLTYYYLVYG